jgi:Tfp pilus assembly protein PilF
LNTAEACQRLVKEAFASTGQWKDKLARAESMASIALADDPLNPLLLTCLGTVLCDQGRHAQARELLLRAIEQGSVDQNTYFNLAVASLHGGQVDEAMAMFAAARTHQPSPHSWPAYFDAQAH